MYVQRGDFLGKKQANNRKQDECNKPKIRRTNQQLCAERIQQTSQQSCTEGEGRGANKKGLMYYPYSIFSLKSDTFSQSQIVSLFNFALNHPIEEDSDEKQACTMSGRRGKGRRAKGEE